MRKMYIKCKHCGHKESLDKRFFAKIIGGAVSGFGFWAWVTYLFAGTGLALPICVAIVTGGVAIAAFADEITIWVSKKYSCPQCSYKNWKVEEGE